MATSIALPHFDETERANTRYLRALTGLAERDLQAPSLLPRWSRAHVVTHLARQADALTRALTAVLNGEEAWMYSSQTVRDEDIDKGATRSADELREDAEASADRFREVARRLEPQHLDAPISRLPGGPTFMTAAETTGKRWSELEIHHADLGLDYTPADWPVEFSRLVIGNRQDELGLDGPSMVLSSTDVDGLWKLGSGQGPEVRGTAAALAWWLVGRGEGSGLVSSSGELPQLGRWR
jgi:maleylpyruvate isomerase